MTTGILPLCECCKHFDRDNEEGTTCKVFPLGIPLEIIAWQKDHRLPYEGDGGVQFELLYSKRGLYDWIVSVVGEPMVA